MPEPLANLLAIQPFGINIPGPNGQHGLQRRPQTITLRITSPGHPFPAPVIGLAGQQKRLEKVRPTAAIGGKDRA